MALTNCMNPSRPMLRSRLLALGCVAMSLGAAPHASGQWLGVWRQAYLRAPHNGAFAGANPSTDRLFNAVDYQRAALYETLWRNQRGRVAMLDGAEYTRVTRELVARPPRTPIDVRTVAPEFVKLVPEIDAMLDWGRTFRRQTLDVLAERGLTGVERDGRLTELVANYRSRATVAVSAQPKSILLVDARTSALGFRRRLPKYNGLGWATRWLEVGLYESLVAESVASDQRRAQDAIVARFRQMVERSPDATPYLLPLTPAIAPSFARRFPEAAAIVDNLNMFEDAILDVLVDREIPRSAKRQELLRVADLVRSDTSEALDVAQWMLAAAMMGVNNMGGAAIDFPSAFPTPTVARGASMARLGARDSAAADDMAGMQHGATQGTEPTLKALMAIQERMMADPVIRERVATDPVLQRMLRETASTGSMGAMPGMQHDNMPGMAMTPAAAVGMLSGTPDERRRAVEFVVRLLSDPAVEARIHAYPELHTLWSDPEVQQRLVELKRSAPSKPE